MPVRAAQAASRQFAPQLELGDKIGPDVMPTQGRVAMDADAYDRAWRIEKCAEELFKRTIRRDRSHGVCLSSVRPTLIPSATTTGDWLRRS
jgi:hypothetical protein